jgi:heat shock protein HslJ
VLEAGRWEGAPYASGAAARPGVTYARDFWLAGDLDGDGAGEAVALLAVSGAGTGSLVHVAVVARRRSGIENVATALIGDRVQIRGARIEERQVVADVVQAGASDAACCPGDLVTRRWRLAGGRLEEQTPVVEGRLTPSAIESTEWVLRSWSWDEPAPAEPEPTLVLVGDRIAGDAGCNRYFASVSEGAAPGEISLGAAGTTRMACAPERMAIEDRFLSQLAGVRSFGFMVGQLALTYQRDGVVGVMLFDARAP